MSRRKKKSEVILKSLQEDHLALTREDRRCDVPSCPVFAEDQVFGDRHCLPCVDLLMEESRAPGHRRSWGAKNHHRRWVTKGGGQDWASQVREELAEVGPSAANSRPASADATLKERLGEGQLSRKGQERRPASNKGGSRGGAEGTRAR